jgi:cytochrome c553
MKKLLPSLTGLSLLSAISLHATVVTADSAVNRLLASQCAQCHGTNGYSRSEFDAIAGEEVKDMYEDLTDMKEEDSPENIMDHQALGYTDEQILRIAAYYASLPEDDPFSPDDESENDFEEVDQQEPESEEEYEDEYKEEDEYEEEEDEEDEEED